MSGLADDDIPCATTLAADDAYAAAGLGPDDVDVVECQDTDAARELLSWQELGLCAPGDQARILADGDATLGGARPINPSGGLLSARASPSAPPPSARSSSWSTSSAAPPAPARSTAPGSASPTSSAAAPTPASPS